MVCHPSEKVLQKQKTELEDVNRKLEEQKQKLENLRKIQSQYEDKTPTSTLEALAPAAVSAEIKKIEDSIRVLEKIRLKLLGDDEVSKAKQYVEELKNIDELIRKITAQTAEIRVELLPEGQEKELELLRVRHEKAMAEIDAELEKIKGKTTDEVQYAQELNEQKVALEAKYQKERLDIIAEYTQKSYKLAEEGLKAQHDIIMGSLEEFKTYYRWSLLLANHDAEVKQNLRKRQAEENQHFIDITRDAQEWSISAEIQAQKDAEEEKAKVAVEWADWATEQFAKGQDLIQQQDKEKTERQTQIESMAYETRWRVFSLFNKNVVEVQDKQGEEFILYVQKMKEGWQLAIASMQYAFQQFSQEVSGKWKTTMEFITDAIETGIAIQQKDWKVAIENIITWLVKLGTVAKNAISEALKGREDILGAINRQPTRLERITTPAEQEAFARRAQRLGQPVPVTTLHMPAEEIQKLTAEEAKQSGESIQISQITGPTRDLFVGLLEPLRNLNILPALMESMRNAIYEMRDAFLGKQMPGDSYSAPKEETETTSNVSIETVNINVQKASDAADIDYLNRTLSDASRREQRLLGRRR
jgi:hypothetical protein